MKTFRYISALLLGMTLVAAPACDGLLDQYPHNAVSSDNLTDADAKLLLTGLYYIVQNKPTANGYAAFDILGGDLIRGGASGNKIPYLLVQDLVTEAGGFISGQWNGYYTALYQVNNFIQSVEAMAQTTSTSEMLVPPISSGVCSTTTLPRDGEPLLSLPDLRARMWAAVLKRMCGNSLPLSSSRLQEQPLISLPRTMSPKRLPRHCLQGHIWQWAERLRPLHLQRSS